MTVQFECNSRQVQEIISIYEKPQANSKHMVLQDCEFQHGGFILCGWNNKVVLMALTLKNGNSKWDCYASLSVSGVTSRVRLWRSVLEPQWNHIGFLKKKMEHQENTDS